MRVTSEFRRRVFRIVREVIYGKVSGRTMPLNRRTFRLGCNMPLFQVTRAGRHNLREASYVSAVPMCSVTPYVAQFFSTVLGQLSSSTERRRAAPFFAVNAVRILGYSSENLTHPGETNPWSHYRFLSYSTAASMDLFSSCLEVIMRTTSSLIN